MNILELLERKPKTNYKVKVSDGNEAKTFDVLAMEPYNEGYALRYKDDHKTADVVYMSRGYRPIREDGFFIVGKNAGNNSAAYIVGQSTDKDCPGEDLSAIIRADGLAEGFKALYESKINWKLLLILAVVAGGIFLVVAYLKSRGG